MTRKHYRAIAEILRTTEMPDDARAVLVSRFVTVLADDNPRFSPTTFRAACEEGDAMTGPSHCDAWKAETHLDRGPVDCGCGWGDFCPMSDNYIGEDGPPHVGHFSRLGGTWWCDTCNSPYCELA